MKLKNQVAIITGAGRNIGAEIAQLFAAEGAKVAALPIIKPYLPLLKKSGIKSLQ